MPLLPLGLHPPLMEASPAPPLHSLHQHRTQCSLWQATALQLYTTSYYSLHQHRTQCSPLLCTSILHCTAPLYWIVFLKLHCTQLWPAQTNTAACTNIALNALFCSTSMASNCTAHLYYIILQPEKHRTQSSALYLQVALHTVTQVWPALALPAMGSNCIAARVTSHSIFCITSPSCTLPTATACTNISSMANNCSAARSRIALTLLHYVPTLHWFSLKLHSSELTKIALSTKTLQCTAYSCSKWPHTEGTLQLHFSVFCNAMLFLFPCSAPPWRQLKR